MQSFGRRAAGVLQAASKRQNYSTATSGYASTASNLRINSETKVIYQGFTGKQGTCVMSHIRQAETDHLWLDSMPSKQSNMVRPKQSSRC